GGGAGAGERRGDFGTNVAGFADADDDDFATLFERSDDGFDGGVKRWVELRADGFERGQLDGEHFTGFGEMTHSGEDAAKADLFQPGSRGQTATGSSSGTRGVA